MGNVCPSNCPLDCCTINANCTNNFNNCFYYYYDWTWVYWIVGVTFTLLLIFTIMAIICRRRRLQRAQQTLIIQTGQGSYQNSNYNNGLYGPQPGYNQTNRNINMNQAQYQMGQPVFLSDGQYTSSNQNYGNNQGNIEYQPNNQGNMGYQPNNQGNMDYQLNNQVNSGYNYGNQNQGYVVEASRPVNPQYNYKQS